MIGNKTRADGIFPLLTTIKNTINNITTNDKIITTRLENTSKNISEFIISNSSNTDRINESIGITIESLTTDIENNFGKFAPIEIGIHTKEETSWSPIENDTLALIRNGKIKKVIKNEMIQMKDEIETMVHNFTPNSINPNIITFPEDNISKVAITLPPFTLPSVKILLPLITPVEVTLPEDIILSLVIIFPALTLPKV